MLVATSLNEVATSFNRIYTASNPVRSEQSFFVIPMQFGTALVRDTGSMQTHFGVVLSGGEGVARRDTWPVLVPIQGCDPSL